MFFHCMTPTRLAASGVIQWKIIKVWINLQYTQNTESINGLSITYTK